MADETEAGGGSGSPQRVAYDLWFTMRKDAPSYGSSDYKQKVKGQLELFQQCLRATRSAPIDTSGLT